MGKKVNLVGMRFGRLVVIEENGHNADKRIMWLCKCDCGTIKRIPGKNLVNGDIVSCGCFHKERLKVAAQKANRTHGMSNTRLFSIWLGMRKRCKDKNSSHYKHYGARGIVFCKEWNKFENFNLWAVNNGYNDKLTLDRIDVNGDYCPENCQWVGYKEQGRNKRNNVLITYNNVTRCMSAWAESVGMERGTLYRRLKNGWSIEKALNTPITTKYHPYKYKAGITADQLDKYTDKDKKE